MIVSHKVATKKIGNVELQRHSIWLKLDGFEGYIYPGRDIPILKGKLDKAYLQWHSFNDPVYAPSLTINNELGYNQLGEYSVQASDDGYSYCYFGGNEIITEIKNIYVTDSTGDCEYKIVLEIFKNLYQ